MIRFPIDELLDERRCYDFLLQALHPDGLKCPHGHPLPLDQPPHDRHRAPIMDYRCRECGAVFNLFTGTVFSKTHQPCSKIVLFLRGVAQGVSTAQLAEELELDYSNLLKRRHRIHEVIAEGLFSLSRDRFVDGSRRNVSECRRKGNAPSVPERSATSSSQQSAWSRFVGE